jgi:hypothetical protein
MKELFNIHYLPHHQSKHYEALVHFSHQGLSDDMKSAARV